MAQLFTNKHRRIQARITANEALVAVFREALLAGLGDEGVKEYSFSSGPGDEKVVNYSPRQLTQLINNLDNLIEADYAKLEGTNLVNFTLRRDI